MTRSVDTSQPLFPALESLPNELISKVAMMAGWTLQMGSATWTPSRQGQLAMATIEYPVFQQQILTLSPHMASFPRVTSSLPSAGWLTEQLPSWKGQCFAVTGIATLIIICPLCYSAYVKTTHNLQSTLFTDTMFHGFFCLGDSNHSKRSATVDSCSWNLPVLPCSPPS